MIVRSTVNNGKLVAMTIESHGFIDLVAFFVGRL